MNAPLPRISFFYISTFALFFSSLDLIVTHPVRWSDRSDWPGICLFCCYQPELIWAFLFHKFQFHSPPPPQGWRSGGFNANDPQSPGCRVKLGGGAIEGSALVGLHFGSKKQNIKKITHLHTSVSHFRNQEGLRQVP